MGQIISNQDAENLRLYTGLGVAGVGLGAATVMYSNSGKPKPKAKAPKKSGVDFDGTAHTGVVIGLDNGFDSDMYDLAVKTNDRKEILRYQAQAKQKWDTLSPKQQADYDRFIRDPLDGHGRKPRPKWKAAVAKAVRKL